VFSLKSFLSAPRIYRLHQQLLGGKSIKRKIYTEFVPKKSGLRVLDVGCGPAPDRHMLGDVQWTGLELNPRYVEYVEKRLKHGDRIFEGDVDSLLDIDQRDFDLVLISGVLHHLADGAASALLSDSAKIVSRHGKIVTIDPVRLDTSKGLEKFLLDQDRGKFIRDNQSYDRLFSDVSGVTFEGFVRPDLGWLPQVTRVTVATKL
jgi:SAM-dependent methyltransferase